MLRQPSSEYRRFRARGIRLNEDMLPELGRLSSGRTRPMLPAVHAFDKAHAVMLCEEGLLARPHAVAILRALRDQEKEGVEAARLRVGGGVHSGEQYLIRVLGEEVGGRLHLARSTGDLTSVAINVLQRECLLETMDAVNRLRAVLVRLAREHTDTILPGYSFGQHAQPMTLAHLHMRERAWRHWATATDLAGALVRERGLPWRTAHQIVGILVRLCEERGLGPDAVTPALLDEAARLYHDQPAGLDAAAIRAALDPGRFIASRTLQGGPAPAESRRQADLLDTGTVRDAGEVSAIRAQLADAARTLEAAIDRLLG
jgi:argininosuccinate lyase